MTQTPEQRERSLQGLRDMLAFFEAHPEIPAPGYSGLYSWVPADGTPEPVRFNKLFDIAEALGSPVTEDKDGSRQTERQFGTFTLTIFAQSDVKAQEHSGKRVVTRPATAPRASTSGECPDERMVADGDWPGRGRPPQHVESDAERGVCRNCGANVNDSYCSNPQPAEVSA